MVRTAAHGNVLRGRGSRGFKGLIPDGVNLKTN